MQVGLAFLAGVAFCVFLVPVNRWLAVKIGQLSTRMMAEKDNRVKVYTYLVPYYYSCMYTFNLPHVVLKYLHRDTTIIFR